MRSLFAMFTILIALINPAQAKEPAGNATHGKKLYDAYCTTCHNESVYLRKDRLIISLGALVQQINSCGHNIDIVLDKTQVDNLVHYLNETYYKFK